MEPTRSYLFVSNFLRLLLIYAFGLVICLISRIVFTFSYGNLQELQQSSSDVAEAFFMGFRTDTMSISYASLPGFLLALSAFFISAPRIEGYLTFTRRFFLIYFSLVYSVFLFIQIIDFYFFRFFGDHLNVMIFGLIEDDTQAIITSMWTDYPVIRILLGTAVGTIVFIIMIRKILTIQFRLFHLKPGQSIVAVLLSVVLVFTGMRNSWGTSPLRIQNTIVSDETFINKIGIGAVYSLQNAFKEKSDQSLNTDIKPTLKKYHFKSIDDVLSVHLDQPTTSQSDISDHFKARTPAQKHLEEKPPHVVVVQMESMSNHLLEFHSKDFNLMGELEGALDHSYIFRNFVSASSVTLNAIEVMLVASPETLISQSTFRERSLSSSAALPFVKAGYNTSFLTGGKLGWHNLEGYLPRQYFNEVEGDESLKENYEDALEGEWGVHDEFLFDYVYKKLENAETPQFIYAMTISNHTPFDLPETYTPYSLTVPTSVDSMLKIDKELAMRNFKTYQYANDCLGKFIKRIQASPLGENTIIVAVGDHSISQLFKMSDDRLLKKLSIPFIVIVPSAYKPTHQVDVNRFGSHKDVFPTLYHLSLSNAEYIKSGNNLCAPPHDSTYFFGVYKYETGFSKDGCVHTDENLTYQWNDNTFSRLKPTTPTEATKYLSLKTRAYSAAMSCYIKNELSKEP